MEATWIVLIGLFAVRCLWMLASLREALLLFAPFDFETAIDRAVRWLIHGGLLICLITFFLPSRDSGVRHKTLEPGLGSEAGTTPEEAALRLPKPNDPPTAPPLETRKPSGLQLGTHGHLAEPAESQGGAAKQLPWGTQRPPAEPRSLWTLPGRVVSSADESPVNDAQISIAGSDTVTGADGGFSLSLERRPEESELLKISHSSFMSAILRVDDAGPAGGVFRVTPKLRVVVLDAGVRDESARGDAHVDALHGSLESGLQCNEISVLADPGLREKILRQLYQYQEGRAIYDPATLVKVGNFHGATHGVFWALTRVPNGLLLEGRLLDFKTTRVAATDALVFKGAKLAPGAGRLLADRLLVQLTDVRILSPRQGLVIDRVLQAEGYGRFLPRGWKLWISPLPEGNSRHYPQQHIVVENDGTWFASDVYLGREYEPRNVQFRIYLILADPDYSRRIGEYLASGRNAGLEISSWDSARCRILDHVKVARRASPSGRGS